MTHDCDEWSTTGECICPVCPHGLVWCPHCDEPDTLPDIDNHTANTANYNRSDHTAIWNGWVGL